MTCLTREALVEAMAKTLAQYYNSDENPDSLWPHYTDEANEVLTALERVCKEHGLKMLPEEPPGNLTLDGSGRYWIAWTDAPWVPWEGE